MKEPKRCGWAGTEPNRHYHDHEWGVPQHDDRTLFEFLILEGAQAGLSWETVLKKRDNYRKAFDRFDVRKVAKYGPAKIKELMANPGLIRNRLKIESAVTNAKSFLAVQHEFGSFNVYLWGFVGGKPLAAPIDVEPMQTCSPESDALSKDLRQRGFRFVGTTICYAMMQAVGLINGHASDCFRRKQLQAGERV